VPGIAFQPRRAEGKSADCGKTKRGKYMQEFRTLSAQATTRHGTDGQHQDFVAPTKYSGERTNEKSSSTMLVNRRSVVAGDFHGCLADRKPARGFVDIR
jgi:hypothetical protein